MKFLPDLVRLDFFQLGGWRHKYYFLVPKMDSSTLKKISIIQTTDTLHVPQLGKKMQTTRSDGGRGAGEQFFSPTETR